MRILHRKLARDVVHMWGQALSISLVIACGVAAFVTMRAMYRSLLWSQATYYTQYRFADVFAELKRAPNWVVQRVRELPGVADAEPRAVMDVTLSVPGLDEPAVGRLISVPPQGRMGLNSLFLRRGRYVDPHADNEVIASEPFASANRLEVGSKVQAVIQGRWQELTIVGIALSPEYIYEIRGAGSLFPDNKRFGVLWAPVQMLEAALNMKGAFNSITVSLQPHANEADVITGIDRILDGYGCLGAYGRSDQISHRFISDEIAQNRISATIIPAIFLAVAALLVHLSFSRLVSMQRTEIAVIKAFGYSNLQVGVHYVQFSLMIAAIGCTLGCAIGWYFGIKLASLYADFYRFPILVYRLDAQVFFWAITICVVTAFAGALGPVFRANALAPAEAMRPESPLQYRPALIDRLKIQVGSLVPRMIFRNIERRPWRAMASAVAICSSVMIVVVEFGMFDALDRMMELQFHHAQREDVAVTLKEPNSARSQFEVARLPGVIESEPFRSVPVRLRNGHRFRKTAILGLESGGDLRIMIDQFGRRASLPPDGLVLSASLAERLDVRPGEMLHVEILEGHRIEKDVQVAQTIDDLLGASAYMNLHALNRIMNEEHTISGAFLQVDAANRNMLYRNLKRLPAIAAVTIKEAEIKSFEDTINRSIALSVGTLILFASVIAAGIVYNGARIALSERARELATLRVLGFTRNEITLILLGEQALVLIFALPFGFLAGFGLCAYLAQRLQTELYRIPLVVQPTSYIWAFVIVAAAALLSGLIVRRRIARLDIISVLKARE